MSDPVLAAPSGWLEPWEPVAESDPVFVAELVRELSTAHPLFGRKFRLVARGKDDDALFAIDDGGREVAAVHLTWRGAVETAPWPHAEVFASLDDFFSQRMRDDHEMLFGSEPAVPGG